MVLNDIIDDLISRGTKTVCFYQVSDCTGAKLFQLLDESGDELAWRWVSDGSKRWRTSISSLPAHSVLPDDAKEFTLPSGRLQLFMLDDTNGTAGLLV